MVLTALINTEKTEIFREVTHLPRVIRVTLNVDAVLSLLALADRQLALSPHDGSESHL